ncbi:MAG: metallophosphoesterase [Pseudomonadota bacterium]
MFRLVQFSDTHLRTGNGRHQRNFSRAMRRAGHCDLTVITGDLSVDGADHTRDLEAAKARFQQIKAPWKVIPGNHDIGEEPASPRQRQPISQIRRDRYRDVFGDDFWAEDVLGWRLVGLNVHLFGTGWAAESRQWDMLETAIGTRACRRVGILVHKPLFLTHADEPEDIINCVTAPARDRILTLMAGSEAVGFITSGHLHQSRTHTYDGVHHIWAPATANPAGRKWAPDIIQTIGFTLFDLRPNGSFRARFEFI